MDGGYIKPQEYAAVYIFASNGSGIYNTSIKVIIQICIETNIRQRGIGNPNPVKLGRCIKELERIYGIQHGATSFQGNQHNEVSPKISESPNQEQLAEANLTHPCAK